MTEPTTDKEWADYLGEVLRRLDTLAGPRKILTKYGISTVTLPDEPSQPMDAPKSNLKKCASAVSRALGRSEQKRDDRACLELQRYVDEVREPLRRLMDFLNGNLPSGDERDQRDEGREGCLERRSEIIPFTRPPQ